MWVEKVILYQFHSVWRHHSLEIEISLFFILLFNAWMKNIISTQSLPFYGKNKFISGIVHNPLWAERNGQDWVSFGVLLVGNELLV